jgi:hypothetical protein
MMVLAIDASTKSSGFAVYENQELKHYGCITAGSTNVFKRIHKMVDELEKLPPFKMYAVPVSSEQVAQPQGATLLLAIAGTITMALKIIIKIFFIILFI